MEKLSARVAFGKTGLQIPPIIFGTSALGNLYQALDDETKSQIVRESIERVGAPVVFDTAGKYGAGLALEKLGQFLRQLDASPDEILISNKLGWKRTRLESDEPTFEPGVWKNIAHDAKQTIGYDGILACWEQGNELLGGRFRPQLVSVHDPDEYLARARNDGVRKQFYNDILEAYRALLDLKARGEVKAVGVGAKDWRVIEAISQDIPLDWVMFANSLTIYRHPPELVDFMEKLHRLNVGIINSAVFNAGFLIGGEFFDYQIIQPDTPENKAVFKWREDFLEVCRKYNVKPAAACIHFAMTPPGVCAVALNTSSPRRVKDNVEAVAADIQEDFYKEMKAKGLIRSDYPFLNK